MNGRQNAWGSTGCPCPAILSQACVPSSTCFFQRSKSCWAPVLSAMIASLLRPRREPAGDLGPAVHRGAPSRDERDVPARELDVFLVRTGDRLNERPDTSRRGDIIFLGADGQHRAADTPEPYRPAGHRELALDHPVLLVV